MSIKRISGGVCLLWMTIGLSGCLNLGATHVRAVKVYQLQTSPLDLAPSLLVKTKRSIAVKGGFIAPANQGTGMAYQAHAYEVNYFVESRWQAIPSAMVVAALAQTLQYSGLFKAVVVSPPYVGEVDQEVNVDLLALTQIFDATLQHSSEHFTVQLILSNGRTGKLQAVKTFDLTCSAGADAESGVKAANGALQKALPAMLAAIYSVQG